MRNSETIIKVIKRGIRMPKKCNHDFRSDEYFRSITVGDIVTTTQNNYRKGKVLTVIDIGKASLDDYLRLKVSTSEKETFFISQKDLVYLEDYPLSLF